MIQFERSDSSRANALQAILLERGRQERKFGRQAHSDESMLAILAEEFGEAAKEVVELASGRGELGRLRGELVQVAAVALQWLESLDSAPALPPVPQES